MSKNSNRESEGISNYSQITEDRVPLGWDPSGGFYRRSTIGPWLWQSNALPIENAFQISNKVCRLIDDFTYRRNAPCREFVNGGLRRINTWYTHSCHSSGNDNLNGSAGPRRYNRLSLARNCNQSGLSFDCNCRRLALVVSHFLVSMMNLLEGLTRSRVAADSLARGRPACQRAFLVRSSGSYCRRRARTRPCR
jgi:hypothetical protein